MDNKYMQELTLQISGICRKDGQKMAYVTFLAEGRLAEGSIPDCRIHRYQGFEEEEVKQLELFMKMNLAKLKKKAASIDPLHAMLKD